MKKILLLMIGMFLTLPTFARSFEYEYEGNTLKYSVRDESEKTVSISGRHSLKNNNLIIPEIVYDDADVAYKVVSIYRNAFAGCDGLTSVLIPGSVNRIEIGAFQGCENLIKAEFASIESLCNINFRSVSSNPLNYAHHLYIDGQEVTDIAIPNTVTSIEYVTFYNCSALTSVIIPNSVTLIGEKAFSGCNSLTSIDIPNSVTYIGSEAFRDCSSMISVNIPNSVTEIGQGAFSYCTGLTSVNIPNSVTFISGDAFRSCNSLTSIDIPNSVTYIGTDAFRECSSMISVNIPNSVTEIGMGAFSYCTALTSVNIPNSVTYISENAFSYCTGLTSVNIPNSITSIDSNTFSYCIGLTSITIPDSVTYIGTEAFKECRSLISATIPNSIFSINWEAFSGCSNLTSVTIPNSINSIGEDAFAGCTGLQSVYYGAEMPITGNSNIFSNETYENATLYLTEEGVKLSENITPWNNFVKKEAHEFPAGIEGISSDFNTEKPYEVYDLRGTKVGDSVEGLASGIYIVRQGKVTKKIRK